MHKPQIAAMAARAPVTGGRQRVQTTSYFRKALKAALRATVGAVCAGSLAVSAVAMDGNGNRWRVNEAGQGDVTGSTDLYPEYRRISVDDITTMALDQALTYYQQRQNSQLPGYNRGNEAAATLLRTTLAETEPQNFNIATYAFRDLAYATTSVPVSGLDAMMPSLASIPLAGFTSWFHYAVATMLRRSGKSDEDAKNIAAIAIVACTGGALALTSDWKDRVTKTVATVPHADWGQKLAASSARGTAFGNHIAQFANAVKNATIDRERRVHLGAFGNCPPIKVQLPTRGAFESTDTVRSLDAWVGTQNNQTGRLDWKPRDKVSFTPAVFANPPVKMVADGDKVWMLSKNGTSGYKIWRQPQFSTAEKMIKERYLGKWHLIPGEVVDLYPGQHYIWAINASYETWYCVQPCDTGYWRKVHAPEGTRAVAIGPEKSRVRSTNGMLVHVWIKDGAGNIYKRLEYNLMDIPMIINTLDENYLVQHRSYYGWDKVAPNDVPDRIKELLTERDSMGEFQNRAYSYPPLPVNNRR